MILDKKETTVAYRCPDCGSIVMSLVGIFTLTADMIRLKCPCGGSEMEIIYTKDKKVRLNVPCFLCPSPHSYLISSQMFFDRDIFALPCSYSGFDICFIGKQSEVEAKTKESEKELLEMLGDTDFSELEKTRGKNIELSDPQILDIVMYVIHELAEDRCISCSCGTDGDYEVDICDDHLTVRCKICGDSVDIPTNSIIAANDFLAVDKLVLNKNQ